MSPRELVTDSRIGLATMDDMEVRDAERLFGSEQICHHCTRLAFYTVANPTTGENYYVCTSHMVRYEQKPDWETYRGLLRIVTSKYL
jgi:hypothetical protein